VKGGSFAAAVQGRRQFILHYCPLRSLSHTVQLPLLPEITGKGIIAIQIDQVQRPAQRPAGLRHRAEKTSGGSPETAMSTSALGRSVPLLAEPKTYTSRAPAAFSAAAFSMSGIKSASMLPSF
jgi:hypothetical protein